MTVIQLASTAFCRRSYRWQPEPEPCPGESLDNGLGELPRSYTAREFDSLARETSFVQGEKIDSGLGNVSREEIARMSARRW